MRTASDLQNLLERMDGRGYKAYKGIAGAYDLGQSVLYVDHVQGDPFAAPSRVRIRFPMEIAGFSPPLLQGDSRRTALCSYLTRVFHEVSLSIQSRRGSGKSGDIAIRCPGQQVLNRNSVVIDDEWVEARFTVGLPAAGRRILGREAVRLLLSDVPDVASRSLISSALDPEDLERHVLVNEDADALRTMLDDAGLVAFVAQGSVLPRRTGVDDRPLAEREAVRFRSPDSLQVSFDLPNAGVVTGMGITRGVTLIVGGGFHGKSSLLNSLERGVYNHIPGDGRELVITDHRAVKIRAEDGRSVSGVDISPFIGNLPGGKDTGFFSTPNASGSTSQAANILEVIEAGARVLLIDEDTAATNFMIRDRRMQELIAKDREPITPFLDRARQIFDDLGVSTVLVMGGSGDYFEAADCVIAMEEYVPHDVTARAREIARNHDTGRATEAVGPFGRATKRVPIPSSLDPKRGKRDVYIKALDLDSIAFGSQVIDLSAVEQLVDPGQTRALADALYHACRLYMGPDTSIPEVLDKVQADVEEKGLDVLSQRLAGDYVAFRRFELAAALNRLRTLQIQR